MRWNPRTPRLVLATVSLLALAVGTFSAPSRALAQDAEPAVEQVIAPTIVELGRLRFVSSMGDRGGVIRHPNGTARIWNYNPDTHTLLFVDPGIGKTLWRTEIDSNVTIAEGQVPMLVAGGKVLLFSSRERAVAFDGHTGQYRWSFVNSDPQRPFNIAPINMLKSVVVLWRTKTERTPQGQVIMRALEMRALDSETGKETWSLDDPTALGGVQVWRGFVSHTYPDKVTKELRTDLINAVTGKVVYTCDYLPTHLTDETVLTVRWRTGVERTKFLLPNGQGGLDEAKFVFEPKLAVPSNVAIYVPPLPAPLLQATWSGASNPDFAKRTFYTREEGTTVHCKYLPFPDDVDLLSVQMVRGDLAAALVKDPNLTLHVCAVDVSAQRLNFRFTTDQVPTRDPEPERWPIYGVNFLLCDAGRNIGFVVELRNLMTLRIVDPVSGKLSDPKIASPRSAPINLTNGEFGWIESDELVICTAGKQGNLTAEPPEGGSATPADVLSEAQRYLLSKQKKNGAFEGRHVISMFGEVHHLTNSLGDDLATSALAGLALCQAASNEFDEFRLPRRAAVRRTVRYVASLQRANGYFSHNGRGSFLDHALAVEFLVTALPPNMADTTAQHREAVLKGLAALMRARTQGGGFRLLAELPNEFSLPQAPGRTGKEIQELLAQRDQGDPLTMYFAQRAINAVRQHKQLRDSLKDRIDFDVETQTNIQWFAQQIQMFNDPLQFMLLLSVFAKDLPDNMQPSTRQLDQLLEAIPRTITAGKRGRLPGAWSYVVPMLPQLASKFGARKLKASIEQWIAASRYPDGQHTGTLGGVQTTALAALTAAALDTQP